MAGWSGPDGMAMIDNRLVPGAFVQHPDRPDWGVGQVQSAIGGRVTVTFENAGKQAINAAVVTLDVIGPGSPGFLNE
jgi:hypothetical protein